MKEEKIITVEIYKDLIRKPDGSKISNQTAYKQLNELVEAGFLDKMNNLDGKPTFEPNLYRINQEELVKNTEKL